MFCNGHAYVHYLSAKHYYYICINSDYLPDVSVKKITTESASMHNISN